MSLQKIKELFIKIFKLFILQICLFYRYEKYTSVKAKVGSDHLLFLDSTDHCKPWSLGLKQVLPATPGPAGAGWPAARPGWDWGRGRWATGAEFQRSHDTSLLFFLRDGWVRQLPP